MDFPDPPFPRAFLKTESEGVEKIFHANRNAKKKAKVAILIAEKQTSEQLP